MDLYFLRFFGAIFILVTFLPLIKLDNWWIRVFDYPRLQKLVLVFITLACWVFYFFKSSENESIFWIIGLLVSSIYLVSHIIPFTFFGKKMIESVHYDEDRGIHILVANVYQYNTKYQKTVNLINRKEPDLVFLVETDQKWEKAMEEIEKNYSTSIKIPQSNTYGLLLYTKLEVIKQQVHYWIDEEIPSLELDIKLRNGEIITIYAIHPTPPVPSENEKSTDRDAEILLVGEHSKKNNNPSLVIGDLNDVAWSYTTELFLKNSEMVDPRRGRGIYNTFNAKIPLLRWPLDHIFLSKEFGLASMKVESCIGSDHFPISLKAVLTPLDTTDTESADAEEKEEAHEKIVRGLQGD